MKSITVQYVPLSNQDILYEKELRITESNYPRYKVGQKFDFGYLEIASAEGYEIKILSMKK